MKIKNVFVFVLLLAIAAVLYAQDDPNELSDANTTAAATEQNVESSFSQASESVRQKLDESVAELNQLREQIAAEKIPLSRKLSDLEAELTKIRLEYQQTSRLLDSRTLDLSNLRSEIKSRQEESTYLSNLFDEYIRNFESRLHIAESQRYREPLEAAKMASGNSNLSEQEIYATQAKLLAVSIERLYDALGGVRFDGTATDSTGSIHHGTFILIGPAAIFQSDDGKNVGTAEQRLGSLEPTVIAFGMPEQAAAASKVVSNSTGLFPFDPTLGNAHKIESTKETIYEHASKGGPVMVPILALAGAALLIALYKWARMLFLRKPSRKKIKALIDAIAARDKETAMKKAKAIGGPVGRMLTIGVEHLKEPRELIEEMMYEEVLSTRLRLQHLLPFVALSASSAPLLGLLGTVTGIINTFKLITVYGSGDIKTLSSGISEALVTTEFGLYVAIPSLLMYAFLSRKARGVVDDMEKAATAFINQVSKTPYRQEEAAADMSATTESLLQNRIQPVNPESVGRYPKDSAGGLMNPNVVSVRKNSTVAEAIEKIRSAEVDGDINAVFIVDENGQFAGHVLVRYLLTRPEQTCVESLADRDAAFVRVDTPGNEVRSLLSKHGLVSIPVLDGNNKLVGRISRNGNGQ
ncbi:MAG: MotA/TolQ/ExbB proton channel family protein [Phycisphaerae bacterium]|nr:MotA/TolQ/ExbB proton channel family protein [Phycisphaerae bacterium]